MHIEAGGNSIGFFIEHEDDLVLAGEALFACVRAVANDDFSEAICEPDGSSVSGALHHARPENLVRFLLPTGYASWFLRSVGKNVEFRLYWDTCDKFVTLIGDHYPGEVFDERATAAVEKWRATHPDVTANWD